MFLQCIFKGFATCWRSQAEYFWNSSGAAVLAPFSSLLSAPLFVCFTTIIYNIWMLPLSSLCLCLKWVAKGPFPDQPKCLVSCGCSLAFALSRDAQRNYCTSPLRSLSWFCCTHIIYTANDFHDLLLKLYFNSKIDFSIKLDILKYFVHSLTYRLQLALALEVRMSNVEGVSVII